MCCEEQRVKSEMKFGCVNVQASELESKTTGKWMYIFGMNERKYPIFFMYKYRYIYMCVQYDGFVMLKGDTFYAIQACSLSLSSVFRLIFLCVLHTNMNTLSVVCVCVCTILWWWQRRSKIYCLKVIIQVKMRLRIFRVITTYLLTFRKYDLIIQINT